jgi:Uma2 family endonuclease
MSTLTPKVRKKKSVVSPRPNGHRIAARSHSVTNVEALLSVDDWLALPDTKPRYELIDGKLIQKMTTTSDHAWAAGELLHVFKSWGQEKGWRFFPEGMGYKASSTNGFVPDVAGFSPHQKILPDVTYMTTPFLVVEVLSPSTAKVDRIYKKQWYASGGVEIFILVDTRNRTLEAFRLDREAKKYGEPEVFGAKDIWQPEELPGFRLELKDLWFD